MKPRSTSRKLNFDKKTIARLDADTQLKIIGGIMPTEDLLPTFRSAVVCFTITCCHLEQSPGAALEEVE